jgi:rubredoxin
MSPGAGHKVPDAGDAGADARDTDSRMECRICWCLYDPAEGDLVGRVAPGTTFDDLPADWCCPRCDSDKSYFLPAT